MRGERTGSAASNCLLCPPLRIKSIAESVKSHREEDPLKSDSENQRFDGCRKCCSCYTHECFCRKLLTQALKDNPYKHKDKPNKNLIHDDDQDIKTHLEKRLYTTQSIWRRLSNYNVEAEEVIVTSILCHCRDGYVLVLCKTNL